MNKLPIHKNFKEEDFACKCGTGCGKGYKDMDKQFMTKVFALRDMSGLPMAVTSGYRCPKHPESLKRPTSAHIGGFAIDFKVQSSQAAFTFMLCAMKVGLVRIGWNQRYDFFHIDGAPHLPQNVLFKY